MSTVINEATDLTITPAAYAGGIANPELVATGEEDLGLGFTMSAGWAYEGEQPFDETFDSLRTLGGGFDLYYILPVVREGSGITFVRTGRRGRDGYRPCDAQPRFDG